MGLITLLATSMHSRKFNGQLTFELSWTITCYFTLVWFDCLKFHHCIYRSTGVVAPQQCRHERHLQCHLSVSIIYECNTAL